jgi:hypothetical protein
MSEAVPAIVAEPIDISPEGSEPNSLTKEILIAPAPDADRCPERDATVNVHYHGMLTDGTVFDSSVERGTPFSFEIGAGRVIRGWDVGVATMAIGEKSRFTIASHLAYGSAGSPPKIPGDATLVFEVELLDFTEIDHFYPDSAVERLAGATERKTAGNALFSAGRFAKAAAKYEKATQLVDSIWDTTDEVKGEARALRATCFSNWSVCLAKLGQAAQAADTARQGIDALVRPDKIPGVEVTVPDSRKATSETEAAQDPVLGPLFVKLCFRLATAERLRGRAPEALAAAERGLQFAPASTSLLKEQKLAQKELAKAAARQQALYRAMFSGFTSDAEARAAEEAAKPVPAPVPEHEHVHEHCGCGCEDEACDEGCDEGCGCGDEKQCSGNCADCHCHE